jgi:hypothetical protein
MLAVVVVVVVVVVKSDDLECRPPQTRLECQSPFRFECKIGE